jgi:diguanylate cyclase (GGDEF)-like protein
MKILIVDDDYVDREHIKRTIRKSDLVSEFTETESVDEALEQFRSQSFDVVLLDYSMPQRDGIELLLELRSEPIERGIAIVMLSNSEDEELAMECVRAGAQDFIPKAEITNVRLRHAIIHAQTRFDLEHKLYQSYRQAKQLAEHDSLTGLANRFLFEETLKMSITNNRRDQFKLAMILFDIDHFKYVNDNHGHDIGDLLLKQTVERVQQCLRGNELFARLGGDEFAIIISNLSQEQDVSNVAQRILHSVEKPFIISGIEVRVSLSIGIAIHPDNSLQSEELYKFADIAMYRAKKLGRNQIVFFEEAMQQQFLHRYKIEHQIKNALKNNEFQLQYQPIFESDSGALTGFEALIRWQQNGTLVMPDAFIGVAEESGSITEIGRWVTETALQQLQRWNPYSTMPLSMSINLSAIQFRDPGLAVFIDQTLRKYQITPKLVEFELTETAFIENSDEHIKLLEEISALGCRIALDDFGTGFSSISHLHKFPIDTVKIDKSLMLAQKDEKTLTLIKGLVVMIQTLGMEIVAEGVETETSLDLCEELQIERVQGYYFSPAINENEIEVRYLSEPQQSVIEL